MTTDDAALGPTAPKLQNNMPVQVPLVGVADTMSTAEGKHPKHVLAVGPDNERDKVVCSGNHQLEFVVIVAFTSTVSPTTTVIGAVLATVRVACGAGGSGGCEVFGGGNVGRPTLTEPSAPTVKAVVGVAVEPAEFSATMRS